MPIDVVLPIYAASALALVAVATYLGRPRIRVRTYNRCHNGLRVIEVAFILSRTARVRTPATARDSDPSAAECAIYVTLKSGNR